MRKFFYILFTTISVVQCIPTGLVYRAGLKRSFHTLAGPSLLYVLGSSVQTTSDPHQEFKDALVRTYELEKHARLAAKIRWDEECLNPFMESMQLLAEEQGMSLDMYLAMRAAQELQKGLERYGASFEYALSFLKEKLLYEARLQLDLSCVARDQPKKRTFSHIKAAQSHIAYLDEQLAALLDELPDENVERDGDRCQTDSVVR